MQRTCAECEYFDAEFGDCLSRMSDRYQTSAISPACRAFYPDTTAAAASEGDEERD
ncbi:hypothetical protein [Burkholderia sp. BCC1644]|uniref:hypothetical protein n=1 Tax=Burkholderia sp. BCC1644 TaxID=2676293 RepID=UPI0015909000|nr:hypothetical protein [Burkholderia sp. BCC1644]